MAEVPDTVDDAIDALAGSPTTVEVFDATRGFSAREIGASAARRAAGGGGSIPSGGTTGQLLAKVSNADGDADWETVAAPSTARAKYSGNPTTVALWDTGRLTWNSRASGSALLSLTAPGAPTVVAAGVYAFSVTVLPAAPLTAGGHYDLTFEIDINNDDAAVGTQSALASSDAPTPKVGLTIVRYCSAGAEIGLFLSNYDGALSQDFQLTGASVQRLS